MDQRAGLAHRRPSAAAHRQDLPQSRCFGEEGDANGTNKNFVWLVNPIDGSINFMRGATRSTACC
ncbi:inositol monophosphatase family protein [Curvibacter delicatus]|uniref:inositol monophosphatase family protein n=1 Tax=Curvibacter delicatus TaxID=80879 RepID=UPI001471E148